MKIEKNWKINWKKIGNNFEKIKTINTKNKYKMKLK